MANTATIGPFETEYKKYWPTIENGDQEAIHQYPNHREFVFEQLLKIKQNIGEYKLKNNPDAPTTKTSPVFFLFMTISIAAMFVLIFLR